MKNVLIIVDVQKDFCPRGNLAVSEGDVIIPLINRLTGSDIFDLIIATQDWHPKGHISFASTHRMKPFENIKTQYGMQALWPDHCVQGSEGAQLHPLLETANIHSIIRKGFRKTIDSYSAFFENDKKTTTGLNGFIKEIMGIEPFSLFIAGIATDVCVFNTAIDAKKILEYERVTIAIDACAGISEQNVNNTIKMLQDANVNIKTTEEIIDEK